MNLVWIFGLAKCTPFERVFDKSVPGTCWDKNKLTKFQLFAACKIAFLPPDRTLAEHYHRLLSNPGLCARSPSMAYTNGVDYETTREIRSRCRNELGCRVRLLKNPNQCAYLLTTYSAGVTGIVKSVMVVHMTDPDFTYQRVDLTIWTLSEPAVSIMAISIPVL
jgi:hypothetical protein